MALQDIETQSFELLKDNAKRLLRTSASMYMFIAEETILQFGASGEPLVRAHLREYGKWRGTEMRMAHQALGLPINIETLNRHWDSASGFVGETDKGDLYSPSAVHFDVHDCPASVVWQAHSFWRWGHVYCDEFHESCASSYHPNCHVVIPRNLMKGDPYCVFRWTMAPTDAEIDLGPVTELGKKLAANYVPKDRHDAVEKALKRGTRLHAGRYMTFARELLKKGDAGEAVLRTALEKWSQYRGRLLRNEHEGLFGTKPPTGETLFHDHDVPYQFLWDMEAQEKDGAYTLQVAHCPLAEVWQEYDALDIGRIYCQATYPSLYEGYGLSAGCTVRCDLCGKNCAGCRQE